MAIILGGRPLEGTELLVEAGENSTPELSNEYPSVLPEVEVVDWTTHPELELHKWKGTRPRRELIRQIVVHTTGGEGDVHQFRGTLRRRRVGAAFFVDRWGTIWQLCDPLELSDFHGGFVNPWSLGIEVACYLFKWPARTRWSWREAPPRGRDREIYQARISGRPYYLAALYPVQVQAVAHLVEILTANLPDVERAVPLEADGTLRTKRFTRAEARSYSGIMGHLHIPGSTKLDPGTQVLEVLRHRFGG